VLKANETFGLNDRYTILSTLGKGGMGIVYKAYDNILKENVAIKTLNTKYSNYTTIKNRFLNEAKICLTLTHPNIIRIRDISLYDDVYFMVMEYIDGVELKDMINDISSKSLSEIYALIRPIMEALDYAHKFTIHRDIKPSNIMIKDNIPYLMDFGISKALDNSELDNDTIAGGMGTKKYVSPEQTFNANDVDHKTDIYSMGILIYELFTKILPKNTAIADPEKLYVYNENISPLLSSIVLKMIEPKPNMRPDNFKSVINIIDKEINGIKENKNISLTNPISSNNINLEDFVYIKEGKFLRGSGLESKIQTEKPRKSIFLDQFYISKYCITNLQYNNYILESNASKPKDFDENLKNKPTHPVVNVSYIDAQNYCTFYNLSLPSEAQWEKASKGEKNLLYPWGNEFKIENCNIGHIYSDSVSVDSYIDGVTNHGIYNMAGNVWEWCLDDFDEQFYKTNNITNPICYISSDIKVLRGGSFDFAINGARNSFRFHENYLSTNNNIGFRVVFKGKLNENS